VENYKEREQIKYIRWSSLPPYLWTVEKERIQ